MKYIKNTLLWSTILFLAISLQGCIKDDLSGCPNITVRLYHIQMAGENGNTLINNHASLYIFDEDGRFVSVFENANADFSDNSYTFQLDDLKPGNYRMAAFRGLTGDYITTPEVFVPGVTTFDQVKLILNCQNDCVTTPPSELFTGELQTAAILNQTEHFDIPLNPLTYVINVRTEGLEGSNDNYSVIIRDDNGQYNFDRTMASCPQLEYLSGCQKNPTDGQPFGSLVIMNMLEGRHPQFIFMNATTQTTLFQGDLMNIILAILAQRNPAISFDEAGRRFDIVLHFTSDMDVFISVNSWGMIDQDIIL